jgi:hypothetical protein
MMNPPPAAAFEVVHHGALCIAAYAFLAAERARLSPPAPLAFLRPARLPKGFTPRGAPDATRTPCADVHRHGVRAPGSCAASTTPVSLVRTVPGDRLMLSNTVVLAKAGGAYYPAE